MAPRKCCCASCTIGSDNFDRADENPVSGNWLEVSGDWEIDNNELNSLSDGVLVTTLRQAAPVRTGNGYNTRIIVDLVIPETGNRDYGIITGYRGTGGSDDYIWIKLSYNGTTGELSPTFFENPVDIVMDRNTHPDAEVWTPSPGANFTVEICASDVEWTVTNQDISWRSCFGSSLPSLPTAPAGGVGFLMGRFDNWSYYIHWESNATCPTCLCFCLNPSDIDDYSCIPDELTLTLTQDGILDEPCPCLDDLTLTMYLSDPDTSGASPTYPLAANPKRWYSDTFICEGAELWFVLSCEPGSGLSLSVLSYPNEDPTDPSTDYVVTDALTPATSITCLPISIVFSGAVTSDVVTCDIFDNSTPPVAIGTGTRLRACSTCYADGPPDLTWTATITE
jgi:hypothetical protein